MDNLHHKHPAVYNDISRRLVYKTFSRAAAVSCATSFFRLYFHWLFSCWEEKLLIPEIWCSQRHTLSLSLSPERLHCKYNMQRAAQRVIIGVFLATTTAIYSVTSSRKTAALAHYILRCFCLLPRIEENLLILKLCLKWSAKRYLCKAVFFFKTILCLVLEKPLFNAAIRNSKRGPPSDEF